MPDATKKQAKDKKDKVDTKASTNAMKDAEKELLDLLTRKRQVDRNLANLEASIYAFEGSYLEDTTHGNIIRGFEGYLSGRTDRKRQKFTDSDRIFSNSSSTYQKALEAKEREEQYSAGLDETFGDRYSGHALGSTKNTIKKKRLKAGGRADSPTMYKNPKKLRLGSGRETESELEV
ncbi:chromatin modification- protein eaf6 [Dimargaris verticillata]|uniref:Chromatin modification-related protein EAF6 n=1 Tax=Dimargaris verticillata TaxID=2761393 RepID=A0A9W8E9X1_9FUNG|nr:chromatin modification- protein eaf6 [Dimargaris verticillata]